MLTMKNNGIIFRGCCRDVKYCAETIVLLDVEM